jgi:hypothetical protein
VGLRGVPAHKGRAGGSADGLGVGRERPPAVPCELVEAVPTLLRAGLLGGAPGVDPDPNLEAFEAGSAYASLQQLVASQPEFSSLVLDSVRLLVFLGGPSEAFSRVRRAERREADVGRTDRRWTRARAPGRTSQ